MRIDNNCKEQSIYLTLRVFFFFFGAMSGISMKIWLKFKFTTRSSTYEVKHSLIKATPYPRRFELETSGYEWRSILDAKRFFSPDVQFSYWSPIKVKFASESLTYGAKHSQIKETSYQEDSNSKPLVKDEGVFFTLRVLFFHLMPGIHIGVWLNSNSRQKVSRVV